MTASAFDWREDRRRQHGLYPGQCEALTRRAEGATYEEIGKAMGLSRSTVCSYLGGARIAMGAETVDETIVRARALELIPYYRRG